MSKRRPRPPEAGLVFREREVCVPVTRRGSKPGAARKVLVECSIVKMPARKPVRSSAPRTPQFIPSCKSDACACGTSYDRFRAGWSFAEAAEMVGSRGKGGTEPTYRPSRAKILRMMQKLKRDEWEAHQRACARAASGAREPEPEPFVFDPDDDFALGRLKRRARAKPRARARRRSSSSALLE